MGGAYAAPVGDRVVTERLTLTVDETAKILGVGRGSLYKAIRAEEFPALRLGRRILVARSTLERVLEGSSAQAEVALDK